MKIIFLLYLTCHLGRLAAQTDSVPIGMITYSHQINLPADNERNGLATLYFNKSASVYIHLGVPVESYNKQTQEYQSVHIPGDTEGFPVYKLHRDRKMWSKIPCYISKNNCIVEDTLGAIDWTIYPAEKRRIAIYECTKAIGSFGGRQYEAWFTYDIPIPSGPYKLGGLPGLILEAKTLDEKVQFLFIGLEISPNLTHLILPPFGKDIHMSYADYIKASIKHDRDIEQEFKANGYDVSIAQIKDTIEIIDND